MPDMQPWEKEQGVGKIIGQKKTHNNVIRMYLSLTSFQRASNWYTISKLFLFEVKNPQK